ncbi:MAG TPA: hypothetical protein PLY66_12855 [Acidobacteriota bacterium]|nr:hypothetical protein [Acidobacteriota bacterium]
MVRKLYTPFHLAGEEIVIDRELADAADLTAWAARFQLGTAGYRDLADTADLFHLGVPFNPLTMAIMTEASCRLLEPGAAIHLGGEVRAWTQEHIDLAARIYAAHGIACRLRGDRDADGPIRTTPIWLSSFGVFYEELAGGENFTASHSQSFKGGRKPMDGRGMQLLDAAAAIEQGVRDIVAAVRRDGRYVIKLAPSLSPLIRRDFDVVAPYTRYLQTIVDREALAAVTAAGAAGFRVAVSTQGGSMGRTSRQIFDLLGIPTGPGGIVEYLHFAESPTYHGIGVVDGVNHGVDPGKWQIYKNIGAQPILLGGRAGVVFIWDPDGDRFNMVTVAVPGSGMPTCSRIASMTSSRATESARGRIGDSISPATIRRATSAAWKWRPATPPGASSTSSPIRFTSCYWRSGWKAPGGRVCWTGAPGSSWRPTPPAARWRSWRRGSACPHSSRRWASSTSATPAPAWRSRSWPARRSWRSPTRAGAGTRSPRARGSCSWPRRAAAPSSAAPRCCTAGAGRGPCWR